MPVAAPDSRPAAPAAGPAGAAAPGAERPPRLALIGNPNSGKTSLFNQLTGLNQKVGNFPGVTVDRKTGIALLGGQRRAEVVDLPGTYSLYPKSLDERVIADLLYDPRAADYPDFVVMTVDASNLRRGLLLFTQLADLGLPAVLALNMTDVAAARGIQLDVPALERALQVPVVPLNARKGTGLAALRIVLADRLAVASTRRFWDIPADLRPLVQQVRAHFGLHNDYLALHYAHQFRQLHFLSEADREVLARLTEQAGFDSRAQQAAETVARYARLNEVLLDVVTVTRTEEREHASNRIDKVLTHRVWGYLIFLAILFLLFQAIFAWAQYPMDWIDQGISALSAAIQARFHGPLVRLLTEGVLAGLGGVLIFIPQIALLFAFLAVLEESGYMARVTFLMDKLMRPFGLSGKSVVPLISGLACAVPAIMGARTIESWKDRMLTIFVTPLMSCSARIPVYTVLVALVVPDAAWLGLFNMRGLVLMGLYLLGVASALVSAWLLKVVLKARERSYFIMEFPVYRWPRWKNVGLTIIEKVKTFVWQAGKVIVAISVLLWVLASYGPGQRQAQAEAAVQRQAAAQRWPAPETERRVASARLETSYAGTFGHAIEPVIRPLGFDWKIGIALLTSFAAREVFVGTMSTIYSVGQGADAQTVQQKLAQERDSHAQPFFTPRRALSLLVFYVFAMQCMSTLATTYRETKSWRWPLGQLVYMTGLAYLASLLVWHI